MEKEQKEEILEEQKEEEPGPIQLPKNLTLMASLIRLLSEFYALTIIL